MAGASDVRISALPDAVVRVRCGNQEGTGFIHWSGRVVTAAHVVSGCNAANIGVVTTSQRVVAARLEAIDPVLDLALLELPEQLFVEAFTLAAPLEMAVGKQVITWGYPFGYTGQHPMLTVGYVSGVDIVRVDAATTTPPRIVLNAAINSGNSGGPLVDPATGRVVGVVVSKLAPLPDHIAGALKGLREDQFGGQFEVTTPSGDKLVMSEAQVTHEVLAFLQSQTQLVVGHSVTVNDLREFLTRHGAVLE